MNSAFSPQSQLKSLEKKIKIKSESVINNLNCLRKRGTAKDYDVFEKDKFNECLNEQMEVSDILSYEKRENVNINER